MLQPVSVPAQVCDSGLRDQQEVQQHLHTAHRTGRDGTRHQKHRAPPSVRRSLCCFLLTDQLVSEDGEKAKQERGADAGQQCFKTGYQTTQGLYLYTVYLYTTPLKLEFMVRFLKPLFVFSSGVGHSIQVIWFDHESSALQYHPGGHLVCCIRSHI